MNLAFELTIALAVGSILVNIILITRNRTLWRKNEAQRQLLEAPAESPKRIFPRKILVRLVDRHGPRTETTFGNKFHYLSDGKLIITDNNDLVGAAFAPGKWISAVVIEDTQQKEAKDEVHKTPSSS